MQRRTKGEILFWSAGAFAFALYSLSAPEGQPWNSPLAAANPVWRYVVEMAAGDAAILTSLAAAFAAGFLAVLVNRYFGWLLAIAAAIIWVFWPSVWNGAIVGDRTICLVSAGVFGLWLIQAILLFFFRKAGFAARELRIPNIAVWPAVALALVFALVSTLIHDGHLGEAASAYARLVVEEAGERVILLNGLCDEQIQAEEERLQRPADLRAIALDSTEKGRSNLVSWVKFVLPGEKSLWSAAAISPPQFAERAVATYPERFYALNGASTTPEKWGMRWNAMKPYLASRDPFLPRMRRAFAYEGNYLGNQLQAKGDLAGAWRLYWCVFREVESDNPAAIVNLNALLRQGYKVGNQTRQRVEAAQKDFAKLLADRERALRVAQWISHFGPVMHDAAAHDELFATLRQMQAAAEQTGDARPRIPDLKTLEEWHPEMMKAYHENDLAKAAHIARAILSRPAWRGFVPAHMVLGESFLEQGDPVLAETFLRVAANATGTAAPPTFVLNEYAEALRQLKRYDEAETWARKAVAAPEENLSWVYRLTLAQILNEAKKNPDEVKAIVTALLQDATPEIRQAVLDSGFSL